MASKLSKILDGLQQQFLLLNELVARVAARPPAENQSLAAVVQQLYSDFTIHIAITQLLLSSSAEDGHASAELDAFAHVLQTSGQTFEALRVASLSTTSNQATEGTSSQNSTSSHSTKLKPAEELEHGRISLRAAMTPLFLSFSRQAEITPPTHSSSDSDSSALRDAFSRRPFALTTSDILFPTPLPNNRDLKSIVEHLSTQVDALAKEWVQNQTAATTALEPSVLSHFWLGNPTSVKDIQDQLVPPETDDALRVTDIPVGDWLKRFTSTRNSAAFVGPAGAGKSAMIDAIVGVHLITPSNPTCVPCRIRCHPGLSEPTLEVAIAPYLVALELLREYGFTQQCSRWGVDYVSLSIGSSDAPDSFQKAWDAWTAVTPEVAGMITEFERPDFQLASKATGLEHVNKMLGYLDAIAFYCDNFGLAFHPFRHDWPVINLAFNPSPDPPQIPELINLPGYILETLAEEDLPYLGQLLQEGVTIVPVISIGQHFSESEQITSKLPELLKRRDSPIPCVIGTYLDEIRGENAETLDERGVASMFWDDRSKSSDVLLCSPAEGVTATFVLHYIDTKRSLPPYEEVWKGKGDLRYWGLRKRIVEGDDQKRREKYQKFTTERIHEAMIKLQDNSRVLPSITSYYRAITAPLFRDEAAAAFRRRLSGTLKNTLQLIDTVLIQVGEGRPRKAPDVPSAQELPGQRFSGVLGDIRDRASEEIKTCLRNARAEVCLPRPKAGLSGEEQDGELLLLTTQSLRRILEHCQKAAERPLAELRSLLADDLMHHDSTDTAAGPDPDPDPPVADTTSRLPTTSASLPIEALSSFRVSDLRVLVLQPFHERSFATQHPPLWQRTGLAIAAFARSLFGLPSVLVHRRRGYYKLSLAALRDRFTSEVIAPWVEEMGRVAEELVREKADISQVVASSETLDPESLHQLGRLVALRCNISAVLAVLV